MPAVSPLPCSQEPELFTGDHLTNAIRREAIALCRTKCPATEFALCSKLEPEPGQVLAGVAYNWEAKPLKVAGLFVPASTAPENAKCAGSTCSELLPPVIKPNGPRRLWCSKQCLERHRAIARAIEREREREERHANLESVIEREIDALKVGGLRWKQASQEAKAELVKRHMAQGLRDPQIAELYGVTTRQVRFTRQVAGIAGLTHPRTLAC